VGNTETPVCFTGRNGCLRTGRCAGQEPGPRSQRSGVRCCRRFALQTLARYWMSEA